MSDVFVKHYQELKDLQNKIVSEYTKHGIRASINTTFQVGNNNAFPRVDNYSELKPKQ